MMFVASVYASVGLLDALTGRVLQMQQYVYELLTCLRIYELLTCLRIY
jgi:hypothetical protein